MNSDRDGYYIVDEDEDSAYHGYHTVSEDEDIETSTRAELDALLSEIGSEKNILTTLADIDAANAQPRELSRLIKTLADVQQDDYYADTHYDIALIKKLHAIYEHNCDKLVDSNGAYDRKELEIQNNRIEEALGWDKE